MGSVSVCSINCLPDDLLVKILSFLPTKQAASTSLLSKRWRTLFAFSHNLDFHNPIILHPGYGLEQWVDIQKRIFDDFVDRTLSLQDGNKIKKFSLTLSRTYKDEHHDFDHWICYALEHGVSELHLHFVCYVEDEAHITPTFWKFAIPSKVFTSTTLVKLSLGTDFLSEYCPRLPSDISLPALKVLLLHSIGFEGNQLSDVFLAACPALEDLTIKYYQYYPKFSYVISSKTIKKLSVTYRDDFFRIISFDTPNVVDFYYSGYLSHESPKCHLDSLSKATLDLYLWRHFENDADVTDLISEIRNVKILHLTISAVELISVFCESRLPVFNNLVDLVLTSKKEGWDVLLPLLLERSPNLKTLVLSDLDSFKGRRHQFTPIPPNNQIKMLRIMEYQGYESDLKRLWHFLLNMKCLEVVQVYVVAAMNDPKKMQLREDLLKLPAASSKLKIQVV